MHRPTEKNRADQRTMASSSSFSEDLTCSICLIIFTDPVMLSCGHSFCRECIKLSLKSLHQCPQCRAAVPADRLDFPTNHILKSLAEKAKEAKDAKAAVGFCPEHDEKLKLFCINDQQLTCIICRDCEKHEGHKFKPVKEAAESFRKELEALLKKDSCDISEIESLAKSQNEEIGKTKEKSQQLKMQIRNQFQEMHQFLKRREDEIMKELKDKENDELETMRERLNVVEKTLSEGRESEEKLKSVLEITDPESFLKIWSEKKRNTTPKPRPESFLKICSKKTRNTTPKPRPNPKASDLQVVKSSLSLGHYETHLQFFVWKEMLQVVKPQAEKISSKRQNPPDWSRWSALRSNCTGSNYNSGYYSTCSCHNNIETLLSEWQNYYKLQNTSKFTINEITPGPNYWEIDVEDKNCFTVQIQNQSLKYNDNKYTTTYKNATKKLMFKSKPKKIGFYLKSGSEGLQFFDADTMKQIQTLTPGFSLFDQCFWKQSFSKTQ